jgi:hypothetical protein
MKHTEELRRFAERVLHHPRWPNSWDFKRISRDTTRLIGHATGPQHLCGGVQIGDSDSYVPDDSSMAKIHDDANFIAAASPAIVIELLDKIAALENCLVVMKINRAKDVQS